MEYDGDDDNFGFNSKKCPPWVDELIPFENDKVHSVESIEFHQVSDKFQEMLCADICELKNSNENLYGM